MKHGGCYDCKEKNQEFLISVPNTQTLIGEAVCDACLAFRKAGAN